VSRLVATPHTTGVAALYLELHPTATPQQVRDALFAATTPDIVINPRTTTQPPAVHELLMKDAAALRARRPGPAIAALLTLATSVASSAAGQARSDASVAQTRLPTRLECGRTFRASITLLNTGATTWTSADGLAAVGEGDVFSEAARVPIPGGVSVASGETYTFPLALRAPEIALPQARTAWRMVDGDGASFGETVAQAIPVECPPRIDDAELPEANLPAGLACGESYALRIAVRNTGSLSWSKAGGYALGLVDGGDEFHTPLRVALADGARVAPGAVHTFAATIVAPESAGTYRLEWRMTRPGAGFFGSSLDQPVRVACPPGAAGHGGTSR